MNWKYYILIILLVLNLPGSVQSQEASVDAIDLPPCDQELVDVLKNQQIKEGEDPNKPRDNKIVISDLTVLVTTYKKEVNCTFEVDGNLFSPLLYAVCMENPAAVRILLQQDADPNFIQPERNVTPMARLAWKSGGKDPQSKLWEDHVIMATDLIQHEAIWDYEFIMVNEDVFDGKPVTVETETSINILSPNLIKAALKRANHDMNGRTPKAKAKVKAQKEAALKKLNHKRKKIKIKF